MEKVKIGLTEVLPQDAEHADPCTDRLIKALRNLPGVVEAHVEDREGTKLLCVHIEPEVLSPIHLKEAAKELGAELASRFGHLAGEVRGIRHERHARNVESALRNEPGVVHASVNFGTQRVSVEFELNQADREKVLAVLNRQNLSLVEKPGETSSKQHGHAHDERGGGGHDHDHGGPFGERTELIFSLLGGVLTAAGYAFERIGLPRSAQVAFIVAMLFGGYYTLKEAFASLRSKRFEIDFLMLVAAAGAVALGEWFEAALLLFLFSFGHALEGFAMSRARRAIEALGKLAPKTALRVGADGAEREVPVQQLAAGDEVLVKPNTSIPADGIVKAGTSTVNQAPITGESVPVDKRSPEDLKAALEAPERAGAHARVFAGTLNGAGVLRVVVTRRASESTLSRVIELVTQADAQKAPTQIFTERFERIFVPSVLTLVALLLFAWVVIDEPFAVSFYRAMAVLVAASPCALAIATPSAVLSGVARAAREGVLVKGGAHLEALGTVQAIAFDKTGTLTEGKPRLTDVRAAVGIDEARLLRVALAVEKQSDHPLARAITTGLTSRLPEGTVPDATEAEAIIGFGVRAKLDGEVATLGKPGLFERDGSGLPEEISRHVMQLQTTGRTVMVVQHGSTFLGVLGVMDTPRDSAREVIARLHALGVSRTIMLSGDNQNVADAVASQVGIDEARGNLLPEQKVEAIRELAQSSARVAMVGDGVNDAPAMAHATVGIAMGAGGSDVALETADIALMADDLRALPFAVGLSRACRRVIRQNLWASLGMVAFLIPATIFGFAGIGLAVALHEGSTLVVVANALRLLAYANK